MFRKYLVQGFFYISFLRCVVSHILKAKKTALSWIACAYIILAAPIQAAEPPRVLFMGDSMLAWNRSAGRSVADYLARETNGFVTDQSRNGASYFTQVRLLAGKRGNIPSQFLDGDWDWIVLNGGGNDLLFGCGCNACDTHIRRLIDRNHAWGAIPDLIHFLLQTTDAKVIYTGYLRSPGRSSMIEHCATSGSELEQRISHMASTTNRLFFLSLQDLVPHGDLTYHSAARIHPSPKGSAAIAARISTLIYQ